MQGSLLRTDDNAQVVLFDFGPYLRFSLELRRGTPTQPFVNKIPRPGI